MASAARRRAFRARKTAVVKRVRARIMKAPPRQRPVLARKAVNQLQRRAASYKKMR